MKIIEDLDLSSFNSYKIEATCKRAFFPENEMDLRQIFQTYDGKKTVLGSGHNIIFSKDYYENDFVIFSGNYDRVVIDGLTINAQAGIFMTDLSKIALDNQLSGLEIFYDIPSSLGGAVVMNAGAGGEDIRGVLLKVRYYNPIKDDFEEIFNEEIGFEYRNSFFQKETDMIISEAWLSLQKEEPDAIKNKMETLKTARWAKQPRDYPNAGSVFKRPAGYYVGAMMDELNLKGLSVGGAKISEKHGGFIINSDNASGKDILDLIGIIKLRIKERYAIDIEIEQRIL